jgi:hypothetical protein
VFEDVIAEEVRETRVRHAEKFNFDLWAIYHDLKKQEIADARQLVAFPPRKRRRSRRKTLVRQPQIVSET